ncbi:hypothetical protein [Companilactobacillus tucceti]|uniref:hypothetical protein n=1 Tax=Companilactobacillus tucceti TaxID=238012 RepID=UPI000A7EF3F3|nr:hypothetical protein [Companilactobacillus tucceti]
MGKKNSIGNKIKFSFSYSDLILLGKNLYSNAWAALSELVANGLDARASTVNLYIDMRDKKTPLLKFLMMELECRIVN